MRTKEVKLSRNLRKFKRKKMSMRFLKNCLLIILFLVVIHFWLKTKSYRFSKEDVVKIGEKYAGNWFRCSNYELKFRLFSE
jgi:cell division protein FtsB